MQNLDHFWVLNSKLEHLRSGEKASKTFFTSLRDHHNHAASLFYSRSRTPFMPRKIIPLLLVLSLILSLTGCSTFATPERLSQENRIQNIPPEPEIFADLTQSDGSWRLTNINASSGQLRLNDFQVNLPDEVGSARGMFGLLPPYKIKPGPLQTFRASPKTLIVTPLTVFTLPVAALLPLGGEFHLAGSLFFPIGGTYGPSQDGYTKAIREAKAADDLDRRLPELTSRYQKLIDRQNNLISAITDYNQAKAAHLQKSEAQWRLQSALTLRKKIRVSISNLSGWQTTPTENQILDKLSFSADKEDWSAPVLTTPLIQKIIFPAKDINAFEQALIKADTSLYETGKSTAENMQTYTDIYQTHIQSLDNVNAKMHIDDSAVIRNLYAWEYRISRPDVIQLQDGALNSDACYCMSIDRRKFHNVTPSAFTAEDSSVSAQWTPSGIHITNKTNKYLTIDAVTVYYDYDVKTVGGSNFINYLELAPGTSTIITSPFSTEDANSYTLTRDEAAKKFLQFGLAIKYRRTEDPTPRSVARRENLSLLPILENLLH